jgi:5-(carboxyamino)imidazole ribonucleotide synthase
MLKPGATIGILGGGQLGRMMATAAAQLGYRSIGYAPKGDNVASDLCADFFANAWTPYRNVETSADLTAAIEAIGTPGILKTRRDGYDGKGQWRIASERDAEALVLPQQALIYEGMVEFAAEFSVIAVRAQDGEVRFWDSTRNEHEDGILARSILPAGAMIEAQVEQARELAKQVAEALKYVGVITLEFFATKNGPVFNEMAPRVHNSGHWTIEGAATSQFANHMRAVAGLPLGATKSLAPKITMENLIGPDAMTAHERLDDADTHLHLYGKAKALKGRKMGHITRVERA